MLRLGCAVLALVLVAQGATAAERRVVAVVAGEPLYEDEFRYAEEEIGEELAQVSEEQRRAVLLRYLIDTRLMAAAAATAGLGKDEEFARRMAYYQRRALRDVYFEKNVDEAVDEARVKEVYARETATREAAEEVRARHILVQTEAEALAIVKRIDAGEDFVRLAETISVGSSRDSGGELDWFGRGHMVQSFEEAAFALQPGQISKPVQSRFGWHVIKVEERRLRPAPTYDEIKDQIRAPMVQEKAREVMLRLRETGKIEVPDPVLAKELQQVE